MAYSNEWNSAFEAVPADASDIGEGANVIRTLKIAIKERMQKDHYFDLAGTDADHGEHNKITLRECANAPTYVAGKGFLYYAANNFFLLNAANQLIQLTANGVLNVANNPPFPAGTKMVFYQDAAPTGWTIDTTLNDKLLYVTKGSGAGGQIGGGVHASGSWTISGLTHVHDHSLANHVHAVPATSNGWGIVGGNYGRLGVASAGLTAAANNNLNTEISSTANTGVANSNTVASNGAWRPAAYCVIVATKD